MSDNLVPREGTGPRDGREETVMVIITGTGMGGGDGNEDGHEDRDRGGNGDENGEEDGGERETAREPTMWYGTVIEVRRKTR